MASLVGRGWRLIGTAIAFLVFGIGGVLLLVIGIPLLLLMFPRRARRQRATRRLVHVLFWLFVRFMALLGVLRYQMQGVERLDRSGLLIVANHPTLLDVVFLLSLVPDATCIVRAGLSSNLFTRAAVRSSGYICNDSGPELIDACVVALNRGSSLIVFPEGTRTNPLNPQKWHRGAANVALRAGIALTPVSIHCDPPGLRKGEPWWHIPRRRMQFTIEVLQDLSLTSGSPECENGAQAARSLTNQLQEVLTVQLERNARA